MAATKLAAAFRGRQGRLQAGQEQRKQEYSRQQAQAEQEEANRVKPRQILRPKGKSYIGF